MLEQKIEALTASVNQLIQCFTQVISAPASVAPLAPAVPPAFGQPAALPNGMPGGPFAAPAAVAAPVAFAPPAAPGAPFSDLNGCTKYAMAVYEFLEAKAPGRGAVVAQLIQHLCGSGSISDLPAAQYLNFYNESEKQKAL